MARKKLIKKEVKKVDILAGLCPVCGDDLEYGSGEPDGEIYFYEVRCPSCDFAGSEQYSMAFVGFLDKKTMEWYSA